MDANYEYLKNEFSANAAAVCRHILDEKRSIFADSSLALVYAEFSMVQLLSGNIKEALALADSGLKLEPKPPAANFSVKALGLLLNGQVKEAEKMYLDWKDQYGEYPVSFSDDLSIFESSGTNSNLEKIRKMLPDNSIWYD